MFLKIVVNNLLFVNKLYLKYKVKKEKESFFFKLKCIEKIKQDDIKSLTAITITLSIKSEKNYL